MPENIKTKISIHWEGENRPFCNIEDYEFLKTVLGIDDDSDGETRIQQIEIEGEVHDVVNVHTEILKDSLTEEDLGYGIDMALQGAALPYNFRVTIYLRR